MQPDAERRVEIYRTARNPLPYLPFKCAKRRAEKNGFQLISNRLADALLHSYLRTQLPVVFWTGTIVAYPKLGEALRKVMLYKDPFSRTNYVLDIPGRFVGRENCALVMLPGTYTLGDTGRKYREYFAIEEPRLTSHFPNELVGSFPIHRELRIPVESGTGIERELWRCPCEYIGPVVRMHADHEGENWRDNVYICLPPSKPLPAVVEKLDKAA